MAFLEIKNTGPIKNVSFNLNKINFFIGPQSSGKSTIAKIISFCLWLEKDVLIHQKVDYIDSAFLDKNLIAFHQLKDSFTDESYIKYESDIIKFEYLNSDFHIQEATGFKVGKVGKNAYIPAERNIITLPGIITLPLGDTNIKNFISDWINIHNKYNQEHTYSVLNLGIRYYYNENLKQDTLILENGNEISLEKASSGLQSVVPLMLYVDYLTNWIYEHESDTSVEIKKKIELTIFKEFVKSLKDYSSLSDKEIFELYKNEDIKNIFKSSFENIKNLDFESKSYAMKPFEQVIELEDKIIRPHFSNIIIEEPEQNLFPKTQVELIKYLLQKINKERDILTITTHSPYVLYALNNCMLGSLVQDNIEDDEMLKNHQDSWVDPKLVSVWALTYEGVFLSMTDQTNHSIQDADGLIRQNYLDDVMKSIMAEFNNLLNYYEPNE